MNKKLDNKFGVIKNKNPIWVSGVYRSGTTFLSSLLGAHSKVHAFSSTVKYMRFCFRQYGDLTKKSNLNNLLDETQIRLKHDWSLVLNKDKIIKRIKNKKITEALVYNEIMQDLSKKKIWLEKLVTEWTKIEFFLKMFPYGKIIHIYRDPRDIVSSYKKMTIETGFAYLDGAFNFIGSVQNISMLKKKYPKNIYTLKLEDLNTNLIDETKKLCKFLNIKFEKKMILYKNITADGENWKENTSFGKAHKGIPKKYSRWKKFLTKSEVLYVELVTQPYLNILGYEGSNYEFTSNDWRNINKFNSDQFIKTRFNKFLKYGKGSEGYKTNPVKFSRKKINENLIIKKDYES